MQNPFKAKIPALPVEDWIDHAAVTALQDETQAALKINEPLQRLVALKALAKSIAKACVNVPGIGRAAGLPLSKAALAEIERLEKSAKTREEVGVAATLITSIGSGTAILGASTLLAIPVLMPVAFGVLFAGIPLGHLISRNDIKKTKRPLQEAAILENPLSPLMAKVGAAIRDIETTLPLDEARQSDHFDAALKVSPALMARFNQETTIASLRANAPAAPPAAATIIKPIPRKG